jgi:hypothetical protein
VLESGAPTDTDTGTDANRVACLVSVEGGAAAIEAIYD